MHTIILASGVWGGFAVGFGIAAAILTIGGVLVLRFQRNRYEFALMRAAMEKGISSFPAVSPPWLASLRQGVMILALGIALGGVGGGAWWLAERAHQASVELLSGPKPRDEDGRLKPEGRAYAVARSQWERAQAQRSVGMALAGAGVVLVLLGAVRVGLARVEKFHFDEIQGRAG